MFSFYLIKVKLCGSTIPSSAILNPNYQPITSYKHNMLISFRGKLEIVC